MTASITTFNVVSMTSEEADRMYRSDWWVNMDLEEAAQKQLFTDQQIMPELEFWVGLRKLLMRGVSQAELTNRIGDLRKEYLGLKTKPSGDELRAAELEFAHGEPVEAEKVTYVVEVPDERE